MTSASIVKKLYFQTVHKDQYQHITDSELLEKFNHTQDSHWLGIVLERYTFLLLGVCMKYLKNEEASKDAVQQIFLKAITELGKYKVVYLKSWLYTVARIHCLMILRDKKVFVSYEEKPSFLFNVTDLVEINEKETTLNLLENSLKELNDEQKACVTLFYLQKKSYQEIADNTGYTIMQVKSFIQNGKRNLKLLIEKKMNQL